MLTEEKAVCLLRTISQGERFFISAGIVNLNCILIFFFHDIYTGLQSYCGQVKTQRW